jgi:hypothetical protein
MPDQQGASTGGLHCPCLAGAGPGSVSETSRDVDHSHPGRGSGTEPVWGTMALSSNLDNQEDRTKGKF